MLKKPTNPKLEYLSKESSKKVQHKNFYIQNKNKNSNKKSLNNKMLISSKKSTYFSPNRTKINNSVKISSGYNGKLDINNNTPIPSFQQNINNILSPSQNLRNSYSDMCTSASLTSQKSSESFNSNNYNCIFVQNNVFIIPNYVSAFNSQPKNDQIKLNIDLNNNYFYNNNQTSKNLINIINNNTINNRNIHPILNSINLNCNNPLIKENPNTNFYINNVYNNNNNNKIKKESNIFNVHKTNDILKTNNLNRNNNIINGPLNIQNSNNINGVLKNTNSNINPNINNNENHNQKKPKIYYNKYDSSKENNMNENTVILALKIKVAKNDIRTFYLKKFDDLFVSIQKFINYNKIKPELEKPLVSIIFKALNKIFWAFNNKIGNYDKEYLNSLNKLWIKNNKKIILTKNKNHNDKSTDSSSENSYKEIKSNSYQNTDVNTSEGNGARHTANSF